MPCRVFGFVAAVLGIVITMQGNQNGPPEEIGHKVAAPLWVRFWYFSSPTGFFQRQWPNMEWPTTRNRKSNEAIKAGMIAFAKGFNLSYR